jgi:hypothetical protein
LRSHLYSKQPHPSSASLSSSPPPSSLVADLGTLRRLRSVQRGMEQMLASTGAEDGASLVVAAGQSLPRPRLPRTRTPAPVMQA